MNEQQRLASRQVNSSTKKEEKDYSKYFESVYQPPSLKMAKKRGKEEVKIERDFGFLKSFAILAKEESFTFVHMAVK